MRLLEFYELLLHGYRPGDLDPEPGLVIATEGSAGGAVRPGGRFAAPRRDRPVRDTYGAGDSFAAGVCAALAAGWDVATALSLGCHCGASCLDGHGPYPGQLRRSQGDGRLNAFMPSGADTSEP